MRAQNFSRNSGGKSADFPAPVESAVTGLSIRRAKPADLEALTTLFRRAALANPDDRTFLESRPSLLDLPADVLSKGAVLVAETADQIVGFARLIPTDEPDETELDGLFVDPDHWRKGIGRALVAACLAHADATALTLTANPAAEPFWTACGFDPIGETQTDAGPARRYRAAAQSQDRPAT